jgi:hypothetical protein
MKVVNGMRMNAFALSEDTREFINGTNMFTYNETLQMSLF